MIKEATGAANSDQVQFIANHDLQSLLVIAHEAVVKDPAFLKDAERAKAQIDPTSGDEVQRAVHAIFDAPTDIVEKAKVAMD